MRRSAGAHAPPSGRCALAVITARRPAGAGSRSSRSLAPRGSTRPPTQANAPSVRRVHTATTRAALRRVAPLVSSARLGLLCARSATAAPTARGGPAPRRPAPSASIVRLARPYRSPAWVDISAQLLEPATLLYVSAGPTVRRARLHLSRASRVSTALQHPVRRNPARLELFVRQERATSRSYLVATTLRLAQWSLSPALWASTVRQGLEVLNCALPGITAPQRARRSFVHAVLIALQDQLPRSPARRVIIARRMEKRRRRHAQWGPIAQRTDCASTRSAIAAIFVLFKEQLLQLNAQLATSVARIRSPRVMFLGLMLCAWAGVRRALTGIYAHLTTLRAVLLSVIPSTSAATIQRIQRLCLVIKRN
jgi:hypothetical protein